ncbi:MAG: hypothetical protein E7272_02250 [Pseudobutyrivibrio ruminis]|uniref:GOLD domain-containing protein n=1 Tax=Pseudobutyrivibrio ruminis TaxID=46206 RepID=A0A927UB17_9FIRM|nr:hypothetical protein [Pseudobutyrivibrio ruminis]
MNGIWETIKFFIASHKVASIAVASVVGVSAVGAGGYGIYNLVTADDAAAVVTVEDDYQAEDVYIPEFKNVVITSESLEKDLTVYISDVNDNPVAGVPFQVKLLKKEAAEGLQSYVDAIKDLDSQIAEYTKDYADMDVSAEENAKEAEKSEASSDESAEGAEEKSEGEHEAVDVSELPSDSAKITKILQDRNVDVTVTDKDGNVIETQHGDISSDPLYTLCLDKETAVQSYAVALKEAEGTVYTDDDEDGVISETDMEPGEYVLCLLNDVDSQVCYEPTNYSTEAEVKDKVEFKVQKEITKQIKKDNAAEDGQKKEKVPVEETLKDTQEFVESRKEEDGFEAGKTKEVVAPKNTAPAGKVTVKQKGDARTSVTIETGKTGKSKYRAKGAVAVNTSYSLYDISSGMKLLAAAADEVTTGEEETGESKDDDKSEEKPSEPPVEPEKKSFTITIKYVDESGKEIQTGKTETYEEGSSYTVSAPSIDGYTLESDSSVSGTVKENKTITFKYKKEAVPAKSFTITIKYVDEAGKDIKAAETKTLEENKEYSFDAATIAGYTLVSDAKIKGTAKKDETVTFKYKKNVDTQKEEATLNMEYKDGAFVITSTGKVSDVKVNGTAVKMDNGKGTFKVTKDGDYALTGVAGSKKEKLYITYTVSGLGKGSSDVLKDKEGNELYLDEACTKKATAADYVSGKEYFYKKIKYKYYGWQSINGNTYYFNKNAEKVTGSQVIQGVQYDFGADGVLIVKGNGIDVSKYQGNIDWKAAKSAVNFAIIRCGYRGMHDGQLHEDPYFYKNMSGAKAAGINVGVYIYSTALNEAEAVQEASMAVAMAGRAGGCSYPIYLDMEDTVRGQSNLSVEQRMAIVNAFCATVQSSGYKAGFYCSKNWMTARMNASAIPGSCSIWIAQYNTSCTYSGRKNMWQYSSKGSVPGIKSHVDMNKSF